MNPTELLRSAFTRSSDAQLASALVWLLRVLTDRPDVMDAVRTVLDERLPDLVRRASSSEVDLLSGLAAVVETLRPQVGAATAMAHLPPITARTARMVGEVLLTAAVPLEAIAADDDSVLPELARTHNSLNIVFSHWGRPEWSVKAGVRAVEVHRRLVERDGDTRVAGLASALSNLAVAQSDADDAAAALRSGAEAVALYRQLDDPSHRSGLANAMSNHAVDLRGAGRPAEALEYLARAVELRRDLVAEGEARAQTGLVSALNNFSVHLAAAGRDREALSAVEEAVRIRHGLAGADESAPQDLARSLNNLSVRLGAVGRLAEGLAAAEEAVRIRRVLVAGSDSHLPDLAQSLTNLSARLTELGRPAAESLAASEEAVSIRRGLARARPARYNAPLAISLHNLSIDLGAAGDQPRALAACEEAVEIRRRLAAENVDEHGPNLAGSLRSLSIQLASMGRPSEAAAAAGESVEILHSLVADRPELRADLGESLNNLSIRLGAVGRRPEALAAIEDAVRIRRLLVEHDPAAHLTGLATSLNNLSFDLAHASRLTEALAASEEAVALRRNSVSERPDRHRRALATELNNLAVSLSDLGRHREGLAVITEAVSIRRDLLDAGLRTILPDLMIAVGNMADQLDALGRRAAAEPLFADLLSAHGSDAWAIGVIRLARADWHAEDGDLMEAIVDARAAVDGLHDDPIRQADAHSCLGRLRRADPDAFDRAWPACPEMPVWLRHLDVSGQVVDAVRLWIDADLDSAPTTLTAKVVLLFTDEAEAHMFHLVNANPGHVGLRAHRAVLRTARRHGVEPAYAEYHTRLWSDGVSTALARWTQATELDELRAELASEPTLLLCDEATMQMEQVLAADPTSPGLLLRAGLLALCRTDGIDAAFVLAADGHALNSNDGSRVLTAFEPRELALARLCASRLPTDADAAFIHAVLALVAGRPAEADHAIARCADLLPSWNRRLAARQLTDLTSGYPDCVDGLTRLRALILR